MQLSKKGSTLGTRECFPNTLPGFEASLFPTSLLTLAERAVVLPAAAYVGAVLDTANRETIAFFLYFYVSWHIFFLEGIERALYHLC